MTVYALDTDTLTLLEEGHPQVCQNVARQPMSALAITVLTVEERLSGWYTRLRRVKTRDLLAATYQKLAESVDLLSRFTIMGFTVPAILRYESLLAMKLGVRSMDLRIAAVALEHGAIVVTRNLRDFRRIPGLTIEDWSV